MPAIDGVSIGLIVAIIGQSATMWYKLGQMERAIKASCPFGQCPIMERAKHEAAPERPAGEV